MASTFLARHSLKTRITLATLAIFLFGIWSLAFYVSRALHEDIKNLLGEQQLSAVSFMAADINTELSDRIKALEEVAGDLGPAALGDEAALQTFLKGRPVLQILFNGGIIAHGLDGKELARVQPAARTGVISTNKDYLIGPLNEGKPAIGEPYLFKSKRFPEFVMAVPIRDPQGKVIGALAGVVNLAAHNFLDDISQNHYGKTGDYLLIAPQYRLVVAASDKSRVMERLPDPGINPVTDRFDQGFEGTAITVNPHGVEVLTSAKGIPVAGWKMVAILPTAEAFAPIGDMKQRMLLATIFLTLLVAGLTWWVVRRQLDPMLGTAKLLGAMSEASRPLQALPVKRLDELGQLITGFNHLLNTLTQREQALQESESLLRESQSNAGLGSYALDIPTGLWKSSAVLDSLLGIDEAYERSVNGWTALVHPDDRAMMADYLGNEVLGQHRAFDKVYRIIRNDDRAERWVHGLGKLEFDAREHPVKLHGTIQDISEKKMAEDALQESHRQLRDLASSLQTMREDERTALARELHDELGQQLLRLRMDLSWLTGRIKDQAPALSEKVEGMKRFIDGSVDSLRHVTTELRLPLLDDLGLAAAALWILDDFSQRTGIEVVSNVAIDGKEIGERITINLFRILQESLTNVARHADATHVSVLLARTAAGLMLDVSDDGRGTEISDKPKLGHGLIGIRERALQLGGRMEIASARGEGFTLQVRVPLAALEAPGEQT